MFLLLINKTSLRQTTTHPTGFAARRSRNVFSVQLNYIFYCSGAWAQPLDEVGAKPVSKDATLSIYSFIFFGAWCRHLIETYLYKTVVFCLSSAMPINNDRCVFVVKLNTILSPKRAKPPHARQIPNNKLTYISNKHNLIALGKHTHKANVIKLIIVFRWNKYCMCVCFKILNAETNTFKIYTKFANW